MSAWSPMTVLRGQHASIFLEATIVYVRQEMTETGHGMEQDAVGNPVPNQGNRSY